MGAGPEAAAAKGVVVGWEKGVEEVVVGSEVVARAQAQMPPLKK